jgi:hypothetical protein
MSRTVAPCGTCASYRRGCRCDECRAANRDRVRKQAAAKGVKPRTLAPCGSKAAKSRHRRNGETCDACGPAGQETHPCGTWQSRRRHGRNGEQCDACAHVLAPCGTNAARRRHARNNETCPTCTKTRHKPAPKNTKARPLAPCGSTQARQRHKRRGETCNECGPLNQTKELQPCGTVAAAKRHRVHGEKPCPPCLQAERDRSEAARRAKGSKITNTTPFDELIDEIQFLIMCGEGEQRILQATGYTGRAGTLRSRLTQAGQHNLANQVFGYELAA